MQVLDHGVEVEAIELLSVIEGLTHWIGQIGVAMENRNVQLVWPPVTVPVSPSERALAGALFVGFRVHLRTSLPYLSLNCQSRPRAAISSNRFTSPLR